MMDRLNIRKSTISISSPGVRFPPRSNQTFSAQATVDPARQCNAFAVDLKKRHPTGFGFFASLPLPNIEASLKEIDAGYVAGCDGIGMLTNHAGYQAQ